MFWAYIYETNSEFLSENLQFLVVKFPIYLNWRVFVMGYPKCAQCRFWSDCAKAQADLNLRLVHMSSCCGSVFLFAMTEINNLLQYIFTALKTKGIWFEQRYRSKHFKLELVTDNGQIQSLIKCILPRIKRFCLYNRTLTDIRICINIYFSETQKK